MLVAGIGNIFLGDDAFGSEVARRLAGRTLPQGVGGRDFGIRAIDLAYALVGETGEAILIDTVSRGGAQGTLLSSVETEIQAPFGHFVVLGMTPTQDVTSVFAVQINEAN